MELTHLSLFSGIGGIDLAAEWAGFKTVAFCEIDKYCTKVLNKHWPDVPVIGDVKDVTKESISRIMADTESQQNRRLQFAGVSSDIGTGCQEKIITDSNRIGHIHGQAGEFSAEAGHDALGNTVSGGELGQTGITLISGGFPCQPHSVAGKRKGASDERNLWPEFRRVIGEIRPRWVLAENVPGLFSSNSGRFFGEVLTDLAALGYSVGWCCYGAVDVGALHRRNRVFIVAHTGDSQGWDYIRGITGRDSARELVAGIGGKETVTVASPGEGCAAVADSGIKRLQRCWGFEQSPDQFSATTRGSREIFHSASKGLPDWAGGEMGQPEPLTQFERPDGAGQEREVERDFRGVSHGVSRRVDRLKCLGNAVVPQQIYPVLKAIADIELINLNNQSK